MKKALAYKNIELRLFLLARSITQSDYNPYQEI